MKIQKRLIFLLITVTVIKCGPPVLKQYQICARSSGGSLLAPPRPADCNKAYNHDANKPAEIIQATIYTKRADAVIVNGFMAYTETSKVDTELTFDLHFWTGEITIERQPVSVSVAQSMLEFVRDNKTDRHIDWISELKWNPVTGMFETNRTLDIDHSWCTVQTYTVRNILLCFIFSYFNTNLKELYRVSHLCTIYTHKYTLIFRRKMTKLPKCFCTILCHLSKISSHFDILQDT